MSAIDEVKPKKLKNWQTDKLGLKKVFVGFHTHSTHSKAAEES